jgi:hypothetical protein
MKTRQKKWQNAIVYLNISETATISKSYSGMKKG